MLRRNVILFTYLPIATIGSNDTPHKHKRSKSDAPITVQRTTVYSTAYYKHTNIISGTYLSTFMLCPVACSKILIYALKYAKELRRQIQGQTDWQT